MTSDSGGFAGIVKRTLVSALGVLTGSYLLDGISYDSYGTLFVVVVVLSLFSAILKPLLVLLALPFVVVTLGVGILFINALLYLLAGHLIEGFTVASFWYAFFGALIVSFFNVLFSGWTGSAHATAQRRQVRGMYRGREKGGRPGQGRPPRRVKAKDDVIDI